MANSNLFTGFVLGVAATLVAREVLKKLPENGTPLTRGLARGAVTLGEKFQEAAAELGEVVEDTVAELQAEAAERELSPAPDATAPEAGPDLR
jgi:hypothetical protein